MKSRNSFLTVCRGLSFLFCGTILWASPMGTAFTYQGRLLDDNLAANGVYDIEFTLYDDSDPLIGNPVGTAIVMEDVDILDGYFIAELDFGEDAFNSQARWLQVAVRPSDSTGDFTDLNPLQKLSSAPYAFSSREVTGRVRTPGIYETLSYTWIPRESDRNWGCAAMSDDGIYQTAAVLKGQIYISADSGVTWTPKESDRSWQSIAMSADGMIQTAAATGEQLYVSTDFGVAWTPKESARFWTSVAMSADGTHQTALTLAGQIYVSANSGNTWNPRGPVRNWYSAAMSADGSIQTAVVYGGQIYISTDAGDTWTPKESNQYWASVAMSADGTIQTAVVYNGHIYVSTDAGQTWVPRESNRTWRCVAMSDDGTVQTAVVYNGQIYASSDSGVTWKPQESSRQWTSVVMSADGNVQTAGVDSGRLYVASALAQVSIGAATPGSLLSVSGDALVTGILNESSDLTLAMNDGAEVAVGTNINSNRKLNLYTDTDTYGLYGENAKTAGVKYGVYGYSSGNTTSDSIGLMGRSASATGDNMGLFAFATTPSSGVNYGIWAEAFNSGAGDAYAGYFNGDVNATGRTSIGTDILNTDKRLQVRSHNDQYGIYSENTRAGVAQNNYGVYGKASNAPSGNVNHALYGEASGTVGANYGVYGSASGDTPSISYGVVGDSWSDSGPNTGVKGSATTASPGANIGVHGIAGNAGTGSAWAGFFEGRGHFSQEVGIGTINPSEKLDVEGNIDVSSNRVKHYRGFPRPDYDSGWVDVALKDKVELTHSVGGNVDNYVVDMQFKDTDGSNGINNTYYGMAFLADSGRGATWNKLTTTTITVYRNNDDTFADQVRIRIWVYD